MSPVYPAGQSQTLGLSHVPPFRQLGEQIAVKKKHQQNDLTLMTETYPTNSLYLLKLQKVQTALK